jgi:high affinity choline transporter 7
MHGVESPTAHWGGIVAIAAMYAVFLAIGWWASRRMTLGTAAEYLVAGRAMPLWMATLTMAATWIDGGYLLGTSEGVLASLASGWQGGVAFGLSLILGGVFFARRMRRLEFVTLVDPLAARFGERWGAVLALPAMFGEVFWSAELLVAIGASFGVILGLDLTTAIVVSAAVVTLYTMVGGMWSVGYTDTVQFALIPIGLLVALPFALSAAGGLDACWSGYVARQGAAASVLPPFEPDGYWTSQRIAGWWDLSIMLVLGGIPWNCYFQRVQSCQTPAKAQWHSIVAGLITIVMTVPPLLFGLAAFNYSDWSPQAARQLHDAPSMALPLVLVEATPPLVAILGLIAIVGAVTSSFSASILSAGSMIGWNLWRSLVAPEISAHAMRRLVRAMVVVLGMLAVVLALRVQSVQKLWFFTSDLVFVLVFPQLVFALFDPRANRTGSIVAFCTSLVLRLADGESILAVPRLLPLAELVGPLLPGGATVWFDAEGHATLFPVRTAAALAGLLLLPLVSRLTGRWDPPRAIPRPPDRATVASASVA